MTNNRKMRWNREDEHPPVHTTPADKQHEPAPPQVVIHAKDCWSWGPQHYECACAEIAKLRGWKK